MSVRYFLSKNSQMKIDNYSVIWLSLMLKQHPPGHFSTLVWLLTFISNTGVFDTILSPSTSTYTIASATFDYDYNGFTSHVSFMGSTHDPSDHYQNVNLA